MKNFKIRRKMLVTFGCVIAIFCVAVGIAIVSLSENGKKFDSFYETGYQVTNEVMEVRRAIQASAKYIGYGMMTESKEDTGKYIENARAESVNMQDGLELMRQKFKGDVSLVDGYEKALASVETAREQVYESTLAGRDAEATQVYFEQVMPGYLTANDYLTKIYDSAVVEAEESFRMAHKSINMATLFLMAVSGLALVVTVALLLYLTKAIVRPIKEIEAAAKAMSRGDLNAKVTYSSLDELGSLSDEMRSLAGTLKAIITDESYLLGEMADGNFAIKSRVAEKYVGGFEDILQAVRRINSSLSDTLSQINEASEQVASSSGQVSDGAQALSQGSTEQASSVQELAATINQISEQIRQNSENCRQVSQTVEYVGGEVVESNERMQSMLSAMEDISQTSEKIGKIIKTIEDIAFQTNILALNAAVEAARAGEAGKGFAVVADEVRNLATKSQEASKNTTQLIESSARAVENGTRIANATAQSLQSVVKGAGEVTAAVENISAASAEQASAATQITIGVDQISSVVQTNSATAEESAAASEELFGQSQMLKGLVSHFKLKEEGIRKGTGRNFGCTD